MNRYFISNFTEMTTPEAAWGFEHIICITPNQSDLTAASLHCGLQKRIDVDFGIQYVVNCVNGMWYNPVLMILIANAINLPTDIVAKGLSFAANLPNCRHRRREIGRMIDCNGFKSIVFNENFASRKLNFFIRNYIATHLTDFTFDEIKIIEKKFRMDVVPILFWTKVFSIFTHDDRIRRALFERCRNDGRRYTMSVLRGEFSL